MKSHVVPYVMPVRSVLKNNACGTLPMYSAFSMAMLLRIMSSWTPPSRNFLRISYGSSSAENDDFRSSMPPPQP